MAKLEQGGNVIKKFRELPSYATFVFLKELHGTESEVVVYMKLPNDNIMRLVDDVATYCHLDSYVVRVTCTQFKIKD